MGNEDKVREMTAEEKKKFLDKVKIEIEDVAKNTTPEEQFRTQLESYQNGMKKQVEELEALIDLQNHLLDYCKGLFEDETITFSHDSMKTEIATKQEFVMKASKSVALMKAKIAMGDKLISSAVKHYDFLAALDFYLGGVLNTPDLEKRRNEVLKDN